MRTAPAKYLFDQESELCAQFRKDGYVILQGIVDPELLDGVRSEIEEAFILPPPENVPELGGIQPAIGRFQDAWRLCPTVAKLASAPRVIRALEELYGAQPHPFQTLTFSVGTQQLSHSDHIHFSSRPLGFMCGAWVALEDVTDDNGPLFYYPGSSNLPYMDYVSLGIDVSKYDQEPQAYGEYEQMIDEFAQLNGYVKRTFTARKGDVLIWAANLIHGGSPVRSVGSSRWSQVTHYLFDDCVHYTPRLSDEVQGKWYVRKPIDVCTGLPIRSSATEEVVVDRQPSPTPEPLNEQLIDELKSQIDSLSTRVTNLRNELDSLRRTKIFRYTQPLRRIYGRLRRNR